MKSKLIRIAASLLFGCMVVSSVPAGMVRAEETEAYSEADEQSAEESDQSAGGDKADGTSEESEPEIQEEGTGAEESENTPESGPDNGEDAEDDSAQSEESAESENSRVPEDEEGDAGTDQAQDDSVIEKNENEINYVFVESPYLETPGTERIAVSFGDGTEQISHISMTVRDEDGKETVWDMAKNAGNVYLFEYEFTDESESGVYEITGFSISGANGEEVVSLSDSGLEAQFGVNEEYEGIEELQPLDPEESETASGRSAGTDEQPSVAEVDPEDLEGASEEIAGALKDAENEIGVSDKAASADDSASARMRTASKSMTSSVASIAALGAKIQGVAAESRTGNVVVALDPGHDSTHTGASSNGLKEEVLTLKIAQYCKAELETYSGVTVYMTRTGAACPYPENSSSGGDIGDRVMASVEAGADIYVSLHLNSSTSSAVNGAEVIIPNKNWKPQVAEEGRELAEAILAELQAVGLNLRPNEIYSKDTTIDERYPDGSLSDYFSVQIYAKEAGIPGIIVEHAFLSNSGDRTYLDSDADLKKLGVADAKGIAEYLGLGKGQWKTEGGKTYYYEGGKKVTGAKKIGVAWYYFDPDNGGAMFTGWRKDGSKTYYYDSNGVLAQGAKKIGNYWYYFNGNGAMHTGWRYAGENTYYYDTQGHLAQGTTVINGQTYFFAGNGALLGKAQTGAVKIGDYWYYFNSDGSKYVGWRTEGTKKYYYDAQGRLAQGAKKIGNSWYYFSGNGAMYTGWRTDGTKKYYYDSEGRLAQGMKTISGKKYYFNGNGTLASAGAIKVGSRWYYVKSDGSLYVGWRTEGGNTYYYDSEGRLAQGKQTIGGQTYYFNGNGTLIVSGPKKIGSFWYYINPDGSKYVGWRTEGAKTYYYDSVGRLAQGATKIGSSWYYFNGNGVMHTGWRVSGNVTYYYDSKGRLATGEVTIDGKVYYFQSNGVLLR